MTTDFGILNFLNLVNQTLNQVIDDNARALINMVMYHKLKPNDETLSTAYLS
jgi:hypothetical protein